LLGANRALLDLAQRTEDAARDFGLLDVATQRQADQHVARSAEILHLHFAKAQPLDGRTGAVDVGRVCVLRLDQRAAGEFDAQVQAARGEEEHGQQEGDEGHHVQHQHVAHEGDVFFDAEEFHLDS